MNEQLKVMALARVDEENRVYVIFDETPSDEEITWLHTHLVRLYSRRELNPEPCMDFGVPYHHSTKKAMQIFDQDLSAMIYWLINDLTHGILGEDVTNSCAQGAFTVLQTCVAQIREKLRGDLAEAEYKKRTNKLS